MRVGDPLEPEPFSVVAAQPLRVATSLLLGLTILCLAIASWDDRQRAEWKGPEALSAEVLRPLGWSSRNAGGAEQWGQGTEKLKSQNSQGLRMSTLLEWANGPDDGLGLGGEQHGISKMIRFCDPDDPLCVFQEKSRGLFQSGSWHKGGVRVKDKVLNLNTGGVKDSGVQRLSASPTAQEPRAQRAASMISERHEERRVARAGKRFGDPAAEELTVPNERTQDNTGQDSAMPAVEGAELPEGMAYAVKVIRGQGAQTRGPGVEVSVPRRSVVEQEEAEGLTPREAAGMRPEVGDQQRAEELQGQPVEVERPLTLQESLGVQGLSDSEDGNRVDIAEKLLEGVEELRAEVSAERREVQAQLLGNTSRAQSLRGQGVRVTIQHATFKDSPLNIAGYGANIQTGGKEIRTASGPAPQPPSPTFVQAPAAQPHDLIAVEPSVPRVSAAKTTGRQSSQTETHSYPTLSAFRAQQPALSLPPSPFASGSENQGSDGEAVAELSRQEAKPEFSKPEIQGVEGQAIVGKGSNALSVKPKESNPERSATKQLRAEFLGVKSRQLDVHPPVLGSRARELTVRAGRLRLDASQRADTMDAEAKGLRVQARPLQRGVVHAGRGQDDDGRGTESLRVATKRLRVEEQDLKSSESLSEISKPSSVPHIRQNEG